MFDKNKKEEIVEDELSALRFVSTIKTDTRANKDGKTFKCFGSVHQSRTDLEGIEFKRSIELSVEDKTEEDTVNKVLNTLYNFMFTDDDWKEVEKC